MKFNAFLDTDSLAELVRLQGFSSLLDPEITRSLTLAGQLLVEQARANTWEVFENPTGKLANAIYFIVPNPQEVQVVVGVPYGHRREFSFKGPDALGRMFPNDPAQPYLLPALEQREQQVMDLIGVAVNHALGRSA